MEEFKIKKITIRTGEFSGLLSIDLTAEMGDVDMDISKILDKNNPNDSGLLQAIECYATKEIKKALSSQEKHRP